MIEPCPHRPACPACPHYGLAAPSLASRARLERIAALGGLPAPQVRSGRASAYRQRARLAVRGRADAPRIGVFEARSHRAVDIPECRVHHPLINHVAAALRRAIRGNGVAPYDDSEHRGALRYVQIAVERSSQSAQVVLVENSEAPRSLKSLAEQLQGDLGSDLHSLWWNGQPQQSNAILGPHWEHWGGPAELREEFAGSALFFPPDAFGQAHLELAEKIAQRVRDQIPAASRVVEYYSGVGALGIGVLRDGSEVLFNEVSPGGLRGLERGLAELDPDTRARAQVFPGSAAANADLVGRCDVVLVDPPRKGLDSRLLQALLESPPRRLVYVSCGIQALERELTELARVLPLRRVEAFDLFPFTDHLAILAVLGH